MKVVSASEGYDLWAESFDTAGSAILALESRVMEPWIAALRGTVIDVGCGTGRWMSSTQAIGVDASREMLRAASGKPGLAGRLARADGRSLPFREATADAVLCTLTIGHMRPVGLALAELARITRPRGVVVVTDFHPEALRRGWKRTFSHEGETREIETAPYELSEVSHPDLQLEEFREYSFDEPERPLFDAAGKAAMFDQVREVPGDVHRPIPQEAGVILRRARVAVSATRFEALDVAIRGATIVKLGAIRGAGGIDLSGHVILPGLINAHDHLEFNLFPRLGRGPWPNATEWARDVYRPDESPVREHRRVPRRVRLYWGGLKNLISGATTVCHHNPYEPRVFGPRFPVRVVRDFGWAHSVAFSPDTAARFQSTPNEWPFVIHAGESTDGLGAAEVQELDAMGALGSRTALVHAVGIRQSELRRTGTCVITCPSSNLFSLGSTLAPSVFRKGLPIALGTDSGITARVDLLEELRVARRIWKLSAASLYRMVTETAAKILKLTDGRGEIREDGAADLIVLRDCGESPCETLLAASRIEMAVVSGRIRLASARFAPRGFEGLSVAGRGTAFVDAKVSALHRAAASIVGETLRLAGKRVRV